MTSEAVVNTGRGTAKAGSYTLDGSEGASVDTKVVKLMKRRIERGIDDRSSINSVMTTVETKPPSIDPKESIENDAATSEEALKRQLQSRLNKLIKPKPKDVTRVDMAKGFASGASDIAMEEKASKLLSVLRVPAHSVPCTNEDLRPEKKTASLSQQAVESSVQFVQQATQHSIPKCLTQKSTPIVPSAVLLRKSMVKKAA